jgi:hypothetical protein
MVLSGRLQRKTRNLQGFTESSVKLWFVAVFSRKRVASGFSCEKGKPEVAEGYLPTPRYNLK